MQTVEYKILVRRLIILAAAQGMIFWYAIEKLFYSDIGVSLSQIVVLGLIAQGSKILFEIPTSVYADRWSRRGTLIFASMMMIIASLTIGISSSYVIFIVGILCWSLSDALRSGVYEAFAYDSLKANDMQSEFRRVHTRMAVMELLSSTTVGLLAGVIGHYFGLRADFVLSIIPMIIAIGLLYRMTEPDITRTSETGENWMQHIGGSLTLLKHRHILWVVLMLTVLMGYTFVWYEYNQLVGIEIGLPDAWFGILMASLALGMAFGAELAHRKRGTRRVIGFGWFMFVLAIFAGLQVSTSGIVMPAIFVIFACMRMLRIWKFSCTIGFLQTDERR